MKAGQPEVLVQPDGLEQLDQLVCQEVLDQPEAQVNQDQQDRPAIQGQQEKQVHLVQLVQQDALAQQV